MQSFRLLRGPLTCPSLSQTIGMVAVITVWHAVVFALVQSPRGGTAVLVALGLGWNTWEDVLRKNVLMALPAYAAVALLSYGAWRFAGRGRPIPSALPWFVACWWQSCLAGNLLLPVVLLWAAKVTEEADAHRSVIVAASLIGAYLVFAPALVSLRVMASRRRTRWRPVCPECGHSVERAVSRRCSECGEPYPSADRFYRRWAIRRLAWDQRRRFLPTAYLQTLLWIVLRPDIAAWRLAQPDRMGRAVRWALVHGVAAAGLMAASAYDLTIRPRLFAYAFGVRELPGVPADTDTLGPSCMIISATAWWLAATVFPVAMGAGLALTAPGLGPAVRFGLIKWGLYAIAAPAWLLGLGALAAFVPAAALALGLRAWYIPLQFAAFAVNRAVPFLVILIAAFGCLWAIGAGSQPHMRRRGFYVMLAAFSAYVALWGVIAATFDVGGLEGLL